MPSKSDSDAKAEKLQGIIDDISPEVAGLDAVKWLVTLGRHAPDDEVKAWAFISLLMVGGATDAESAKQILSWKVRHTDFGLLVRIAECSEFVERLN